MSLPIFLIGARGCGKTTVGEALAAALNYAFSDTDHYLQHVAQQTVAEIVAQEGWEGFRARETASLMAVTAPASVIATGGGMVLAEHNRSYMREHGQVIYLRADAAVLAARLQASPQEEQRPTLTGRTITDEMADVLAERDALYLHAAHHVIDAMQSPEHIVRQVIETLAQARAS
ncbi:shikimate kinase [Paramixta manurensis]|uniref:Shikimate kinase 2 n=1 Tax=Paramixta manurensis TaxID=2740817 RepID=A0A6M8U9B7_9GAMM|nr:shikimate kinase [Erwiniaceae bacterium PD-1]